MLLRWFEHSQVYHPARDMVTTGAELGEQFEDVFFQTSDGIKLNAWFYPAKKKSTRSQWAVLVCHGNAGNISTRLETFGALLKLGLNVFMFDYRGYGRSQGRPSEQGTYLDAKASYQWLLARGFAAAHIVAFGESLGGGIATELATCVPLAGLVLESTYSCTTDLGAEMFPWLPVRHIARIKYDNCGKLPRLKIPVLIMHSRGDELIGFHHAEKNYSLANEPKFLCELEGAHNEPLTNRSRFFEAMEKFLKLLEARSLTPAANPSDGPR